MAMPVRAEQTATSNGCPWFRGRLVLLGFGSIGQGLLPLLLDRLRLSPQQILVISPGRSGMALAERSNHTLRRAALALRRRAPSGPPRC